MEKSLEQRVEGLEKKVAALEGQAQEQPSLTANELMCIARHINHYIKAVMEKKENVPDACTDCKEKWCSHPGILNGKVETIIDPYPTFLKLAEAAGFNAQDDQELQGTIYNDHIDP